jgi:hypothetical protein
MTHTVGKGVHVVGSATCRDSLCSRLPAGNLQQSDSVGLVVISEEDTRTLLIHRISREDIYQRQGGEWGPSHSAAVTVVGRTRVSVLMSLLTACATKRSRAPLQVVLQAAELQLASMASVHSAAMQHMLCPMQRTRSSRGPTRSWAQTSRSPSRRPRAATMSGGQRCMPAAVNMLC